MVAYEWTYEEVCAALVSETPHPGAAMALVGTSGSTGTPKVARLTAAALTASARATLEVLGGPELQRVDEDRHDHRPLAHPGPRLADQAGVAGVQGAHRGDQPDPPPGAPRG